MVCGDVLRNEPMKKKLHIKCHLTTKHLIFLVCRIEVVKVHVRNTITVHSVSRKQQFRQYFAVTAEAKNWMRNSFSVKTSEMPEDFTVGEQESLTELSCDETLTSVFRSRRCWTFGNGNTSEYPALSDNAVGLRTETYCYISAF